MKKTICIILTVAVILVTCLGCMAGCNQDDGNTIKLIEVTHSVFYAPLYVAIDGGYFEEEGLKIQLSNGGGADKCMTSIIAGQSDIGLMGPEAAIILPMREERTTLLSLLNSPKKTVLSLWQGNLTPISLGRTWRART